MANTCAVSNAAENRARQATPCRNKRGLTMKPISGMHAILLASVCGLTLVAAAPANAVTYTSFQVTGAAETFGVAIDAADDIAGTWYDNSQVPHGFLRTADGTIATFDPPGSTGTMVYAMNNHQWIVGSFTDAGGTHGFYRKPNGTITVYDAPGSNGYTEIFGININNAFTGSYGVAQEYGFIGNKSGAFTSFAPPNGGRYINSRSITAKNATAGDYVDAGGASHAFIRLADGTETSFDVAGLDEPVAFHITGAGVTAGTAWRYPDSNSGHGYLRHADGTIKAFQVVKGYETDGYGLNGQNVMCGEYYDAGGNYHGFIRSKNGVITTFDAGPIGATVCQAINNAGHATGYYYDQGNIAHGYLRTP